jgi:hypothetical protein
LTQVVPERANPVRNIGAFAGGRFGGESIDSVSAMGIDGTLIEP